MYDQLTDLAIRTQIAIGFSQNELTVRKIPMFYANHSRDILISQFLYISN